MNHKQQKKTRNCLIFKFLSPAPIIVVNVSIDPDKNIEKKHQGQAVLRILSKI